MTDGNAPVAHCYPELAALRQIVAECARQVYLHAAGMREENITIGYQGVSAIADGLLSRFDHDGFGLTSSDGRHAAGGMQMSATEGAITQRPAHPMDTISGGPISPSGDDALDALQWLYSVCSVEDDSKYAAVTNAARVISETLEKRSLGVAQAAGGCGVWQRIEGVMARSNDEPMLLYFPPEVAGSYKQSTQPAMYRTGHPDDFPFRKPSHYMLVGSPSDTSEGK